jgi:cytidylate kinase
MEGRDIGSSVFPDAELKIFLNADVAERANRRYKQLLEKGECITYEKAREMIETRDYADTTRKISPLIKTEDMIEINTTDMSIEKGLFGELFKVGIME